MRFSPISFYRISEAQEMAGKTFNIILEKLKIGYLIRLIHGAYCNLLYPEYNLSKALA